MRPIHSHRRIVWIIIVSPNSQQDVTVLTANKEITMHWKQKGSKYTHPKTNRKQMPSIQDGTNRYQKVVSGKTWTPFFFPFIFISWRLVTLQYCSGFCHTLTWISHGVTCIPHPDPPSLLPLHPIPLGLPSAPGPSTCLMHPAWAGDLFHVNSFWLDYLPAQVEFSFLEGEPSEQFQCCGAERLTKLNLRTTGNTATRKCSMMLMGLNSQQKTSWHCLSTARTR